ncbi:MAG: hypothetical protein NTW60_01080, partial [Candidatus Wolfebacteria bacterium]|nr:hypothetical protein [Candidatus Wolfebacteria bacterium]
MKKLLNVFLILNLAFSFVIASFSTAKAASLTELSDTMSSLTGGYSNHTIKFKTPSGINANTDTIIITFAHGSADGTNYTDIDLSHGVSTGYEGDENLGSSAGANQWGASVNSGPLTITLTAPTDAGASEIVGGEYIVVEVGLNATTGTAGNAQLNGVGGPGDTDIMTIAGTFGDTGQIAY